VLTETEIIFYDFTTKKRLLKKRSSEEWREGLFHGSL
jgi:hypothetical protein